MDVERRQEVSTQFPWGNRRAEGPGVGASSLAGREESVSRISVRSHSSPRGRPALEGGSKEGDRAASGAWAAWKGSCVRGLAAQGMGLTTGCAGHPDSLAGPESRKSPELPDARLHPHLLLRGSGQQLPFWMPRFI